MGNISYANQYREGANAALIDILEKAAAASGYDVEFRSGYREGDSRQHGKKNAIDVTLIDPKTGQKIPDYQSGPSFRTYEEFAQTVRQVQQQYYPELSKNLRWGGYFSGGKGKYGALDLMHFDLAGDKLGMLGGTWDKGLTAAQKAKFPGAVSVGLNGKPRPPLGLTNEAFPVTANPRILDQKRTQFYANLQNTPLPRPRPDPQSPQPTYQPGMVGRGQPATAAPVSPALASARQRLQAARTAASMGDTSTAAMSVTPTLPEPAGYSAAELQSKVMRVSGNPDGSVTYAAPLRPEPDRAAGEAEWNNWLETGLLNFTVPKGGNVTEALTAALQARTGASNAPKMDQSNVQARATLMDEGLGSLLNSRSISPGALNPSIPTAPGGARPEGPAAGLPAPPRQVLERGTPANAQETQRPNVLDTTNRAGNVAPAPSVPTAPAKQYGTVNGKTVEIGKVYTFADGTSKRAVMGPGGQVSFEKVSYEIAPGVKASEAGGNTAAGGLIRAKVGEAIKGITAGASSAPNALKPLADTASGAALSIGNFLGGAADKALSIAGNAAKSTSGGNTLSPSPTFQPGMMGRGQPTPDYGKVLTDTFANPALQTTGWGVPEPKPANTLKPIVSTIANPAYAEWVAKYGDGSQVQTAPTGGMITANQLAAIQGTGAPIPAKKPYIPPAPAKTITVSKPAYQAAPQVAAPPPAQTFKGSSTGRLYTVGQSYLLNGRAYIAQADGTFAKQPMAVKSALSTSPTSSSSTSQGGSSSSSSGVPAGYTDLGGGAFMSESGGIYYTRNL